MEVITYSIPDDKKVNNEKIQADVKNKVANIMNELKGLSIWQAFHVLECAKEELEEKVQTESNLIILS